MIKMIARGYWTALRSGREDDSRWMGPVYIGPVSAAASGHAVSVSDG